MFCSCIPEVNPSMEFTPRYMEGEVPVAVPSFTYASDTMIEFITDVEGNWEYFLRLVYSHLLAFGCMHLMRSPYFSLAGGNLSPSDELGCVVEPLFSPARENHADDPGLSFRSSQDGHGQCH